MTESRTVFEHLGGGKITPLLTGNTAMTVKPEGVRVWPADEWRRVQADYLARIRPWVHDRLRRMSSHNKHPVYDFLFEYYSFRPAHLLRWTPGFDVILEGATIPDVGWTGFEPRSGGLILPSEAFPRKRIPYLQWAVNYLTAVGQREPGLMCQGLHEWAMMYRASDIRHASVPLRLSRAEIDAVVESYGLRCTHYDAFRFFTPAAVPRNRWVLTRAATVDYDQPGCLHVNMDLYRFAYKIAPFCPSELVAEAFDLARLAREIDMRASPYDLTGYGFEPIRIETPAGRAEYVERQREVYARAQPLRQCLLAVYQCLLARCGKVDRGHCA